MNHNSARYAHIDGMRAVAVMLVVVAHAGIGDIVPGGSGVTIFFGISGFIITHLLLKEKDRTNTFDIRAFYTRRAAKILPPLFVIVIIPTLAFVFVEPIRWDPLLGITFFYYNWQRVAGIHPQLAGSDVVWSLSIEEQFYLAFAAIWFTALALKIRMRWIALGAFVAALLSLCMRIALVSGIIPTHDYEVRVYYASDTRLDAIAFGVLTAIVFHKSLNQTPRVGLTTTAVRICQRDSALFFAISIYLLSLLLRDEWFRYTFRFSMQAVATCIVLLYGFGSNQTVVRRAFDSVIRLRIVQFIGLSSYSIYLVHLIVIRYSLPLIGQVGLGVRVAILTLLGTLSGFAIYLAVERPVQMWRKRVVGRV